MIERQNREHYKYDESPETLINGRWMRDTWGVLRWVQIGRADRISRIPDCGTESGYTAHRRNKETACDPCKEARKIGERLRVAKRRLAAQQATRDEQAA